MNSSNEDAIKLLVEGGQRGEKLNRFPEKALRMYVNALYSLGKESELASCEEASSPFGCAVVEGNGLACALRDRKTADQRYDQFVQAKLRSAEKSGADLFNQINGSNCESDPEAFYSNIPSSTTNDLVFIAQQARLECRYSSDLQCERRYRVEVCKGRIRGALNNLGGRQGMIDSAMKQERDRLSALTTCPES
ncbi:hypothetical protein [Sphingomonas sp. Leaf357]|uniref:hypothetical protein n=1 Tax=Sphingomonas sp. Leaf357 TaxID=1736350 RepID=UPI0012E2E71B|nr:hypothetical protein [Sphingomonas sp. Leaf357]